MAGLLYFISGSTVKPRPEEIESLGLAFDHPPVMAECMGQGPDGKPGVTVADPNRVPRIGVYLDEQHWEPVPALEGEPKLYIGWSKKFPPTPQDLARESQVQGPRVKLADGNEWMVPSVWEWSADDATKSLTLPRAVKRSAEGSWVYGDVVPAYKAIWTAAQEYWQKLLDTVSDGQSSYEWPPLFDFACELLRTNYSILPMDVSALTLFTSDNVAQRVCNAAIDWLTFVEWIEKKSAAELAGAGSSPGPVESPQITDQPLPI